MTPLNLDNKKRLLGVSGLSVAAAGLAALLPATAHAQLYIAPPGSVSMANPIDDGTYGTIYWDPFSNYASVNGWRDNALNLYFSHFGSIYNGISQTCSFPYKLNFVGSENMAANLSLGTVIDSNSSYTNGSYAQVLPYDELLPVGASIFGYRFENYSDDSVAGYGWAVFVNDGTDISLISWGTSMGTSSLQAGLPPTPVPESASLAAISGLFFAGIVAFTRWKKRRNAQPA